MGSRAIYAAIFVLLSRGAGVEQTASLTVTLTLCLIFIPPLTNTEGINRFKHNIQLLKLDFFFFFLNVQTKLYQHERPPPPPRETITGLRNAELLDFPTSGVSNGQQGIMCLSWGVRSFNMNLNGSLQHKVTVMLYAHKSPTVETLHF